MTVLADLARRLAADRRPVVVFDTCSLLDCVRAPLRGNSRDISAARRLIAAASGVPPRVELVTHEVVQVEWADNIKTARVDGLSGVGAFAACWEIATLLDPSLPALGAELPSSLVEDLEDISKRLLDSCRLLPTDQQAVDWAMDRVFRKLRPSRGGRVKDCLVYGYALRLSLECKRAGADTPRLFVSSNTSDFAGNPTNRLHPDLVDDANAAGLQYAASLRDAVELLTTWV